MSRFEASDKVKTPWFKNVGDIPVYLDYFDGTMWEMVDEVCKNYPDYVAFSFMGKKTKYKEFQKQVNLCARALKAMGIRNGDKVTICLPNFPRYSAPPTK